jgi:hypothetical protein
MRHQKEIRAVAGDLPLMCRCTKEELANHMACGTLPGNVRYTVTDVATIQEANDLAERARAYVSKV